MSPRVVRASWIAVLLCVAPALAHADRAAVLALPGPGGSRDRALRVLPALSRRSAAATQAKLVRSLPAQDALARLQAAREAARAQMTSFTELEQAESAVTQALAAAFDALPYLDDVSAPVGLAFDLATLRLALDDRDGAGEALGLSARLDPAVTTNPSVHPPALQRLANEVRPPPGSPPPPLPVPRARSLGGLLGVDVLVIVRPAAAGAVDVFIVRAFDGVATAQARIPAGARLDDRLHARLVELELARRAPTGAVGNGHGGGGGSSPWPWLVPTLIGVTAAAVAAVLVLALPPPRDDAQVIPAW